MLLNPWPRRSCAHPKSLDRLVHSHRTGRRKCSPRDSHCQTRGQRVLVRVSSPFLPAVWTGSSNSHQLKNALCPHLPHAHPDLFHTLPTSRNGNQTSLCLASQRDDSRYASTSPRPAVVFFPFLDNPPWSVAADRGFSQQQPSTKTSPQHSNMTVLMITG